MEQRLAAAKAPEKTAAQMDEERMAAEAQAFRDELANTPAGKALAEYKQKLGVPQSAQSCHTAVVDGYSIEGHVPAADIQRLLKDRPKARGLAVPGMPVGSPGMESGARSDAYSVILIDAQGNSSVYQKYPAR